VGYENSEKKVDSVYSKRIKAGKRRTYFFDVRATRGNDYFLTITESRKRPNDDGYDRHKIFLYKEDFNKFLKGLSEAVEFVKTDLMPDFDFDSFNHEFEEGEQEMAPSNNHVPQAVEPAAPEATVGDIPVEAVANGKPATDEEVDKW
jgi:hypothetical protein